MSDTINALITGQRNQSVLDSIANPTVVNPLGGIQAGAEAAKAVMGVRALAARQAWGDALSASTDPKTGVVDYGAAVARMAQDQRGALGMPEATEGASARTSEALNRAHLKMGWYQGAVGALPDDATREQVLTTLKSGLASGILDPGEVAKEAAMVPTNPADMPGYIQQHRLTASSAREQTGLLYGTNGLTAVELAQPFKYIDENKVEQNTTLGGYLQKLGIMRPSGATPPAVTAAPPAAGSTAPPPVPAATAPPLPTAYKPPGAAVAPPPASAPTPLPPVFQAPTTPPSATVTISPRAEVTPPPGPALAGVAAPATRGILSRLNPIGSANAAPYPVVGSIPGPGPQLDEDVKHYNAATTAVPDVKRNITAGESALEALDIANSGPGTSTTNRILSFAAAQGIPLPAGWQSNTEAYQEARKQMLRFAQSTGKTAGTDLGLETQLHSNANIEELLKGTNRNILLQGVGIKRQELAQTLTAPPGGVGKTDFGNGMADHVRNFAPKTDWHAFSWDLMNPDEREAYYKSIKDNPTQLSKWQKSMEVARDSGVWSKPPAPAPAAAPAPVMRPGPVPTAPVTPPPRVNLLAPP
jgi:hypothetical protein